MITNITLENFKCFRQVSINPKLLTVLIGPNGTGKSSILQALLVLRQTGSGNELRYGGSSVNLGDPADVAPNFLEETSEATLSFDSEDREQHTETLERLRFVPAARGLTKVSYALDDRVLKQIPTQKGLGYQEDKVPTNLAYRRDAEEALSKMLERVSGIGLQAEVIPDKQVSVKSVTPSGPVNMVSEGFGANALIQLLHQLIIADKRATVLIEEPEIHLHPKAQAELAEVLAETAKAEDKQIIMTTHSEHILSRLLTLVAEKGLSPEQLAIYSFQKDGKGECSATEIEVTELGQVTGGLTGFFDANLDEMDRYVKALQNQS